MHIEQLLHFFVVVETGARFEGINFKNLFVCILTKIV